MSLAIALKSPLQWWQDSDRAPSLSLWSRRHYYHWVRPWSSQAAILGNIVIRTTTNTVWFVIRTCFTTAVHLDIHSRNAWVCLELLHIELRGESVQATAHMDWRKSSNVVKNVTMRPFYQLLTILSLLKVIHCQGPTFLGCSLEVVVDPSLRNAISEQLEQDGARWGMF